jgi:hypothetical protein
MTSSIEIIERIEHNIEARKPIYVELAVFDVRMVCRDFCARLKPLRNFFCNLVHLIRALQRQKDGHNTRSQNGGRWRRAGGEGEDSDMETY